MTALDKIDSKTALARLQTPEADEILAPLLAKCGINTDAVPALLSAVAAAWDEVFIPIDANAYTKHFHALYTKTHELAKLLGSVVLLAQQQPVKAGKAGKKPMSLDYYFPVHELTIAKLFTELLNKKESNVDDDEKYILELDVLGSDAYQKFKNYLSGFDSQPIGKRFDPTLSEFLYLLSSRLKNQLQFLNMDVDGNHCKVLSPYYDANIRYQIISKIHNELKTMHDAKYSEKWYLLGNALYTLMIDKNSLWPDFDTYKTALAKVKKSSKLK